MDLFRREIKVRLVDVANRHHVSVVVLQERVEPLVTTVAQPNKAQSYQFVSTQHSPRTKGCAHTNRRYRCRSSEVSPSDSGHDDYYLIESDVEQGTLSSLIIHRSTTNP